MKTPTLRPIRQAEVVADPLALAQRARLARVPSLRRYLKHSEGFRRAVTSSQKYIYYDGHPPQPIFPKCHATARFEPLPSIWKRLNTSGTGHLPPLASGAAPALLLAPGSARGRCRCALTSFHGGLCGGSKAPKNQRTPLPPWLSRVCVCVCVCGRSLWCTQGPTFRAGTLSVSIAGCPRKRAMSRLIRSSAYSCSKSFWSSP